MAALPIFPYYSEGLRPNFVFSGLGVPSIEIRQILIEKTLEDLRFLNLLFLQVSLAMAPFYLHP